MIDKKTRIEIVKLLISRRKGLGHKIVTPLDLYVDLDWMKSNVGILLEEVLNLKGILSQRRKS